MDLNKILKYLLVSFGVLVLISLIFFQGSGEVNQTTNESVVVSQASNSFSSICSKIQSDEPPIRNTAVKIARDNSGSWNVGQLVDLFLWMKKNINYVNDPSSGEYFALATETLNDGAGDCEDQAILISSLIRSVGGTSKVLIAKDCSHGFSSVFIGNESSHFQEIINQISQIYYDQESLEIKGNFNYYLDSQGYWLIVDPAGGQYLGDLLPECENKNLLPLPC